MHYLHDRNAIYRMTPKEKQNEAKIIKHIQQANKYNTSFDTKSNKQQNWKDNTNPKTRSGQISLIPVRIPA
jgi:hypothetical protein